MHVLFPSSVSVVDESGNLCLSPLKGLEEPPGAASVSFTRGGQWRASVLRSEFTPADAWASLRRSN